MAQQDNEQEQPKYLTHDDLNGALASQKRDFAKMLQAQAQQHEALINTLKSTLGPPPEAAPTLSKTELSEETLTLRSQVKQLLERDKQRDDQEKRNKMEKTLRDSLHKHGIKSNDDLAIKYLQDQVSYDEDGSLVMKYEVVPGVLQPLPISEAVAKFASTDKGKFLADARNVRGSGSGNIHTSDSVVRSVTDQVVGSNGAVPIFKDAKALQAFTSAEMSKHSLKY
jgi:hypothetical protein